MREMCLHARKTCEMSSFVQVHPEGHYGFVPVWNDKVLGTTTDNNGHVNSIAVQYYATKREDA